MSLEHGKVSPAQEAEPLISIDVKDLEENKFCSYRKTVLTKARILSEVDHKNMGGIVLSKEGPVSFQPGDYLAMGVEGEQWPIRATTITENKKQVGEADINGWANFEDRSGVRAQQLDKAVILRRPTGDPLTAKAGDWVVNRGNSWGVVDAKIFSKTYALAES